MMTKEQMERFFRQECTPAEAATISEYLVSHPDMAADFLAEGDEAEAGGPSTRQSARMWRKVRRHTHPGKVVHLMFRKMAVAASLILAVGLCAYFLLQTAPEKHIIQSIAATSEFQLIENRGAGVQQLTLPDGSTALLQPASSLRFCGACWDSARTVLLKGEARFQVAKDPARPFTVYAEGMATRALGTVFDVKAWERSDTVFVRLIEGKVAVRKMAVSAEHENMAMILRPGDQAFFLKTAGRIVVQSPGSGKTVRAKSVPAFTDKALEGDSWYMFNNQSLTEVLDQLQLMYGQRINYRRSELSNMSFIGRLDGTDSLQNILRSIALLNDLQLTRTQHGFLLKK